MVNELSTYKHTVKLNDLEGSLPSPREVSGQMRVVSEEALRISPVYTAGQTQ